MAQPPCDISPKELQNLSDLLFQRRFDKLRHEMARMQNIWLPCDRDASLTVKSLKTYEDLIKLGAKSIESEMLMKHVNQHLWNEIHQL